MDTHWGKYQGPLAALLEHWNLDGDFGDYECSDSDMGEGSILWTSAPFTLTYRESEYLRGDEFECTPEDLEELASTLEHSQALQFSWDSRGFLYGWSIATVADRDSAVAEINRRCEELDGEEDES